MSCIINYSCFREVRPFCFSTCKIFEWDKGKLSWWVIKNKVLCKFYQNGLSEDYVIRGLANVSSNRFKDDLGGIWDCCEIIDQSEYKVAKSVESYYKKD